jgi:RluA family pseudouridine synthase
VTIIKKTYPVNQLNAPTRFNSFCEQNIKEIPSRKGIKKAIKKGELLLNGKITEGGRWLKSGDLISLVDTNPTPPKIYTLKIPVVYEDEHIAVLYKPAGISVSGNQYKTVVNTLGFNLKKSHQPDALNWPLPVHRLDNPTSGLLIIAKTTTAQVQLGKAFERKEIQKKYHALVIGKTSPTGTIDHRIEDKPSHTTFKTLTTVPSLKNQYLSLVELEPQTGRTHQLRIHCAAIKSPILGDKIYGTEGLILKHKGLFLCAVALKFLHPITLEKMNLSIPTPQKFLTRLENESRRYHNYRKNEINDPKK